MKRYVRFASAIIYAAVIAGCAVPPSPAVRAFGDNKFWITVEDMKYVIGTTNERIVVPKGFVTTRLPILGSRLYQGSGGPPVSRRNERK